MSTVSPKRLSPSRPVSIVNTWLDHQHLRAGLRQKSNNFVWLALASFLARDKERDAARCALLAKEAMRPRDRDVLDDTGYKDGDSGGVTGMVKRRTNTNDCTTQVLGSMERLPQVSVIQKPDVHNMSKRCCSATPKVCSSVGGKSTL